MDGLTLVSNQRRFTPRLLACIFKPTQFLFAVSQYEAYIEFAANNTYRPLISQSDAAQYLDAYDSQCKPAMAQCTGVTGNDDQCSQADDACRQAVEYPLESLATFDVYDIRASSDSYPPETYTRYLSSASVKKAIGATSNYVECGNVDIGSSDSRSHCTLLKPDAQN